MSEDLVPKVTTEVITDFQDNILDHYDQVAYHFTFFMMNETDMIENDRNPEAGLVFDPAKRHVIIESGITANYLIDDVSIMNVLGPGRQQRTSTAYKFEFTVYEPGGVTLLDTIYNTSLSLGIANYYKCTYYFEVTFRGRSESSSEPSTLGRSWIWPIVIIGVDTSVTAAGTTYKFEATLSSQMASSEQYGAIDASIEIGGSTLSEAMKTLEKALYDYAQEKITKRIHLVPDEYKIFINPIIGGYSLKDPVKINMSDENTIGMDAKTADNSKSGGATNEFIQITKIIDMIMSASPAYAQYLRNTEADNSPKINESSTGVTKRLHKIIVDSETLQYDDRRADYAHRYTYYILPYEIGTLQCTAEELANTKIGAERYKVYKENKWLQKHYQYIFTGMNDQILNLDLNFNLGWFVRVPLSDQYSNTSMSPYDSETASGSRGAPQNQPGDSDIKPPFKKRNLISDITNYGNSTTTATDHEGQVQESYEDTAFVAELEEVYGISAEENTSIQIAILDAREKRQAGQTLSEEDYKKLLSTTEEEAAAFDKEPTERPTQTEPPPTGETPNAPTTSNISTGAADIIPGNTAANATQSNYSYVLKPTDVYSRGRIWPPSFLSNQLPYELRDMNSSVAQQDKSGRKYVEYMFAQAFSAKSGDLVNLTMTIKGDPYWLSPAPFQKDSSGMRVIKRSEEPQPTDYTPDALNANGLVYQNYLLLTLRTPAQAEEDTGYVDVTSTCHTFSGVYGVIYVTNKFNNGLYSQEIEGVIEPLINYLDVKEVEG